MAKIQLGAPPATFARKIKFDTVDGGKAEINVAYRYRTRSQFEEFTNGIFAEVRSALKDESPDGAEQRDRLLTTASTLQRDAAYIEGCVVRWDLEDELGPVAIAQLVDEFPGAAAALVNGYREAVLEGRSKN